MLPLGIRRPNVDAEAHQRDVRVVEPRRVVVNAADVPEGELDWFVVDGDADGFGDATLVLFRLERTIQFCQFFRILFSSNFDKGPLSLFSL